MECTCDCGCNEACKIGEYLDTENCSCEKRLCNNFVLTCKDKILKPHLTII